MQVWQTPAAAARDAANSAVTIGVFDGVHRGHQAVIARMVETARSRGLRPVVVTFDPNPLETLQPDRAPAQITTLRRRLELIADLGVSACLVLRFDTKRAAQPAEEFVDEVLVGALHARAVVVGEGFRFGHRAAGTTDLLADRGREAGFTVELVAPVGEGARWSSTLVRTWVTEGRVGEAAIILGRPHEVSGTVVHGDHRGRQLGFPTANLKVPDRLLVPADGVYAGWAHVEAASAPRWPAAISVGTNPTFAGRMRHVEGHVLDRDDLDLYGRELVLEFVERLRPTWTFPDAAQLVAQMHQDVAKARVVLGADNLT